MVESALATIMQTSLGLVQGTNLFAGILPREHAEGVVITVNKEFAESGSLTKCLMTILALYKNYTSARNMADSVAQLLLAKEGTLDGTLGTAPPVTTNYYGKDDQDRHMFSVSCLVTYTSDKV